MAQFLITLKIESLRLLLRILAVIPRSLAWRITRLSAWLMLKLRSRSACSTEENLRLAQPALSAKERSVLTLSSLNHSLFMLLELAKVWTWPWHRLAATIIIDPESEQLLDRAVRAEKGLVVLAPHLGNWELLGFYIQQKVPLTVLYQPVPSVVVNQLMLDSREKYGTKTLPTNRQGVMGLFKSLKQGGATGILPDQVPEKSGGAFAPFFGVSAFTMTLVHSLIQRTGCQVLMGACLRTETGFKMIFAQPTAELFSEDQHTSLTGLNQSIEKLVQLAPEQYQWEYKRYRRLMPGEAKRYVKKK